MLAAVGGFTEDEQAAPRQGELGSDGASRIKNYVVSPALPWLTVDTAEVTTRLHRQEFSKAGSEYFPSLKSEAKRPSPVLLRLVIPEPDHTADHARNCLGHHRQVGGSNRRCRGKQDGPDAVVAVGIFEKSLMVQFAVAAKFFDESSITTPAHQRGQLRGRRSAARRSVHTAA